MYKHLLKPFFFLFPAEAAHALAMNSFLFILRIPLMKSLVRRWFAFQNKHLPSTVAGVNFPNPVGMAAGFDKNARYVDALDCLGFGFVEVGTVTPVAQKGNEKPRLFRLPDDEALVNRMGFNNDGVKKVAERLRKKKSGIRIGGNIGKNKNTPNEKAIDDYEYCFRELAGVVDYFVVNVSSPNTPGLRELQEKEPLKKILFRLQEVNLELAGTPAGNDHLSSLPGRKPIFLKIAPDLTKDQLDDILEVVSMTGIDGVVATNTTVARNDLKTENRILDEIGAGGLSGKPLEKRSTEVIRYIHQRAGGKIPIIGAGGIHSPDDAKRKMAAGASLVQLYTGFIYEGPGLIKRILKAL